MAVDPKDRNHLLFSKGGQFHAYESKDGGPSVREFTHSSAFFVMIDHAGWFYTATQSGAFVSTNGGDTWTALHVWFESISPPGRVIDRVPHDYQRIVPDFRTNQIAFPSDQGLHYVNRTAIRAGIFNDLGSGSNVDITVIRDAAGAAAAGGEAVRIVRGFQRLNEVEALRAGHVRPAGRVVPRGATNVVSTAFTPHSK